MRRLAIVVVALCVALLGVVALAPLLVPTDAIRDRLLEQVSVWLGRPVTAVGQPTISIYPRPTVRIEGVTIGNADAATGPFMTIEVLTGTARLLPLLFGRVELREFELERPVLALRIDEAGQPNWAFQGGTVGARVADALDPDVEPPAEAAPDVSLGRFVIVDGTVTYQVGNDAPTAITGIALDITWPSTGAEAEATGSLTWRGERIALEATLDSPLALIADRQSTARFSIAGPPVSIDFDGVVSREGLDFAFDGETAVVTPSLRRLLAWSGSNVGDAPTLGRASIRGHSRWQWPLLAFSSASMSLDGNDADGAFTVDFAEDRPAIRGTIAAESLDLSPYATAFQTDVQADGAWSGAPIDLPALAVIDWDVRVSAGTVTIGGVTAESVAASAVVARGAILLSIGEATLYEGRMQGSLTGTLDAPHLAVEGQVSIVGMDVFPAFADVLGVTSVTGTAWGFLDVAGAGTNWGELVEDLNGTLQASIVDGSLSGIDLGAAARLALPTVESLTMGTDPTEFSRFSAVFRFEEGDLRTDDFTAASPAFDVAFAGAASLMRPTIGGEGIIRFHRNPDSGYSLPFTLDGTWFQPVLLEDPDPMPDPFVPPAGLPAP
ncbi:MAG: AsmA family protein [Bauldia sp.]